MNHRPSVPASNSRIINGTALGFSILFLLASLAAACFVGEWGHVFLDWRRIMISPCPLVTDYLAIGGLSSAFLNAGACGLACFFFMRLSRLTRSFFVLFCRLSSDFHTVLYIFHIDF